jgi:methyl-accepting chemotaxis protein
MPTETVVGLRLTIVARLLLMTIAGVLASLLIAGAATWGSNGQTAAAREMALVSDGMMTGNVAHVSASAAEISGTVAHITRSSESTAEDANTTRTSAERVSSAAGELEGLIGQFRY